MGVRLMLVTRNRTLCEMICRNPDAYSVEAVHRAAVWMLGYLNLSTEEIQQYAELASPGDTAREIFVPR